MRSNCTVKYKHFSKKNKYFMTKLVFGSVQ